MGQHALRRAKAALGQFPALYIWVQRLRYRRTGRRALLSGETHIMIEGFPRSANGWSVRLFHYWQGGKARIAHHEHHEAHVIAGCRRGIPVLVLIREPLDAVRSWRQRDPDIDPDWALRRWTSFYRAVERHADQLVIATFLQATSDLGRVIKRINMRFGTGFYHSKTDQALVELITGHMNDSSRPDPSRQEQLVEVVIDCDAGALEDASTLYARLAAIAQRQMPS